MSRFHVNPDERVAIYEFDPAEVVSDQPPNVITIRARMSVEIAGRVSSEIAKLGANNQPELYLGAHTTALLLHNILGWSGPDFDGLPCTPENIRALPPAASDPFIEKVVNEIGERNKRREGPSPKSHGASTSESAGAAGSSSTSAAASPSLQLVNGTSRSPLRSVLDGRLSKSGD